MTTQNTQHILVSSVPYPLTRNCLTVLDTIKEKLIKFEDNLNQTGGNLCDLNTLNNCLNILNHNKNCYAKNEDYQIKLDRLCQIEPKNQDNQIKSQLDLKRTTSNQSISSYLTTISDTSCSFTDLASNTYTSLSHSQIDFTDISLTEKMSHRETAKTDLTASNTYDSDKFTSCQTETGSVGTSESKTDAAHESSLSSTLSAQETELGRFGTSEDSNFDSGVVDTCHYESENLLVSPYDLALPEVSNVSVTLQDKIVSGSETTTPTLIAPEKLIANATYRPRRSLSVLKQVEANEFNPKLMRPILLSYKIRQKYEELHQFMINQENESMYNKILSKTSNQVYLQPTGYKKYFTLVDNYHDTSGSLINYNFQYGNGSFQLRKPIEVANYTVSFMSSQSENSKVEIGPEKAAKNLNKQVSVDSSKELKHINLICIVDYANKKVLITQKYENSEKFNLICIDRDFIQQQRYLGRDRLYEMKEFLPRSCTVVNNKFLLIASCISL